MITEASYIEIMKNCSKWNNRIIAERKRVSTVLDQQTGVLEKPTQWLYRSYQDRQPPTHPQQVCTYPSKPWRKHPGVSSDSIEMKYFLNSNPALNDAINAITNPPGSHQISLNDSMIPESTIITRGNGGKIYDESEPGDIYDMDDLDNDPSDEDDWGDRRPKRKKKGDTSRSGGRPAKRSGVGERSGGANSTPQASSKYEEPKPFVCPHCGVKYKSRPGLTYHKLHVHMDSGNDSPKSPILSPSLDISDSCDFCGGDRRSNANTGKPEELVTCHDCGRSAHPSCLKFTANMLASTKKYGWQCIECKSCAICGTSENDDQLLFCDDCDRGFHLYCLKPPLKSAPENEWSCFLCQKEFGDNASLPASQSRKKQ